MDRLSHAGDEAGLIQGQAQILPSNLRDETISYVPGILRRRFCAAQHDHPCAWGKLRQGAREDLVEKGRRRNVLVVIENDDGGIGWDRNATRATLGEGLSVSAFPLDVPV
ncbi:MAG: hypothetical protein ACREXY_00415 [Gammaproteobacteria bacterium]